MFTFIQIILFIFTTVGLYLIHFIVIKPLLPLLLLKIKFGSDALLLYYPVFGYIKQWKNSLKNHNDMFYDFKNLMRKHENVKMILTNYLNNPLIILVDSEYIKRMYLDHQQFQKFNVLRYNDLLDRGLLMSEGEIWKQQRNLFGTAFTYDKLASRIPMINQVVRKYCQNVQQENFLPQITGQIVINSFFGELAQNFQLNKQDAQIEIISIFSDLIQLRQTSFYTLIKQLLFGVKCWNIFPTKKEQNIVKRITQLRQEIKILIEKRIQQFQKSEIQDKDQMNFLDIYLNEMLSQQNNRKIEIEEVIQQFIGLFFAGTDTTATMGLTCLVYLAQQQQEQQEIYDEIIYIVGQNNDIQANHLNKLEKLNAFIQEVFRLKNPAFQPFLRQLKQDTKILDLTLKKGWLVVQRHDIPGILDKHNQYGLNFNMNQWCNNSNFQLDNGFIHIPFAAGGRNCIGQHMALIELKIIICYVLRQYKIYLNSSINIKYTMKFLYCVDPENCLIYEKRQ